MDFILECYAKDHSDKMTYVKEGISELEIAADLNKSWANRLIGSAKESFKQKVTFKLPEQYTTKPQIKRYNNQKSPKS